MISASLFLTTLLIAIFCPTLAIVAEEPVARRTGDSNLTSQEMSNWPHWRGPKADGIADEMDLPLQWSRTENHLWTVALPGWGTSSPVVYNNRVVVTSEVEIGGKHELLTLCFDLESGKELWRHDFGFGVNQQTHEKSNLAVNTLHSRTMLCMWPLATPTLPGIRMMAN